MNKSLFSLLIACAVFTLSPFGALSAELDKTSLPFLSPVFGDHMVLQQGKENCFWGWARPGEAVQVELAGQKEKTVTGADGRWELKIMPPAIGGPYTVRVTASQTLELHDVLVGDVWLCGGQSNMELPLSRTRNGEEQIKNANHPLLRLFTVKSQSAYEPTSTVTGSWKVCSPKTVVEDGGFSAVGYYFALKIQSETNVPIGLIKDCIGGTPAESWTSIEALKQFKDFDAAIKEVERLRARGGPVYGNYVMPWYDEYDIGQKGNGWASQDLDESDWKTVTIPGGFRDLGVPETPSVCYFRKAITLPQPLPPGKATIHLGVIEKMDTTQVNGHWIGASAWVENPRAYPIPDGVLKPGTNLVTVRVFKLKPDGGFQSKSDQLYLELGDKTKISLAGEWKGKLSVDARPPHPLPFGFENWPVMPSVLYNGMIAPVAPLAITGAIWYQGEANTSHALQYRTLLPAMIADWRKTFGQGDFPFYIVSLPAFMQHRDLPGGDGWTELRDAQAFTASSVPNCGLAVTVDTGDPNDIHPKDKKVVGERLALCSLANHYGMKIPCAGPTFSSMDAAPGALRLRFKNTDGGLVAKGDKLEEFALAGNDHKWVWAEAKIDGADTIIVSSPKVPEPKAVSYAWQSNPRATLFNGAGLPAVPFRADKWSTPASRSDPH
jgi:sialate O-acetylesterase